MDTLYYIGLLCGGVFAVTGVIASQNKGLDIFSVVLLGVVTAIGGGTIRDLLLANYPIFWIADLNFLWVAIFASIIAFFTVNVISNKQALLLYLDALGASLFAILATHNTLQAGYPEIVAIIMGLITAIFGGILRDVLTGRPTLLMSQELYATPLLAGSAILALLYHFNIQLAALIPLSIALTFLFRAACIYFHIHYPAWLCRQ